MQIPLIEAALRMGLRTVAYFVITTAVAVTIGIWLAMVIKPGDFIDAAGLRSGLGAPVGFAALQVILAQHQAGDLTVFGRQAAPAQHAVVAAVRYVELAINNCQSGGLGHRVFFRLADGESIEAFITQTGGHLVEGGGDTPVFETVGKILLTENETCRLTIFLGEGVPSQDTVVTHVADEQHFAKTRHELGLGEGVVAGILCTAIGVAIGEIALTQNHDGADFLFNVFINIDFVDLVHFIFGEDILVDFLFDFLDLIMVGHFQSLVLPGLFFLIFLFLRHSNFLR